MLIVLARAKASAASMERARGAIAEMVAASNAEEGCIAYAFTEDLLEPGVIHIIEKWQDEAALLAHFATPHMAAIQAALAGLDFQVIEAIRYRADDGAPVM